LSLYDDHQDNVKSMHQTSRKYEQLRHSLKKGTLREKQVKMKSLRKRFLG
jgi:hypothetical protein